jgi:hypothetical protein
MIGNNFDLNLTIRHTKKINFKIQIARDHEEDELKIYDFLIQRSKFSGGGGLGLMTANPKR